LFLIFCGKEASELYPTSQTRHGLDFWFFPELKKEVKQRRFPLTETYIKDGGKMTGVEMYVPIMGQAKEIVDCIIK
jgi:hypothetical protein